jgi:hypothetical protein
MIGKIIKISKHLNNEVVVRDPRREGRANFLVDCG